MNKEDLILDGINLLILAHENISDDQKIEFEQRYLGICMNKRKKKEDCCVMEEKEC